MKKQKNYIGLDLGTGFLGYAVTDENYEIINVNKKRAIGVRVYDEAETAKNRRMFRVARRRLERRKYRICLLQELFAKDMMKEHPNFFALLNESDLNKDDRTLKECEYSLFNDKNFTDKEYYKKYPTIYHLRDELTRTSTDDIRLLYLAIHNIIKYRGNFLTESSVGENEDSFENCKNINSKFKELCDKLEERKELLSENNFEDDDGVKTKINNISALNLSELDKLNDIIISRDSKKERKEKACEILGANEKYQKLLVGIIFGSDLNITTLFGNGAYEKGTVPPFNFSDNYEDIVVALSSALSDVDFEIVSCLKSIYDWQVLMRMLNGSESLSLAMIKKYEAHQRDLKDLKWLLKNYNPKQ
ncbi:MAG: CRISPR-associated endonuclease Cas9 REC1/REC2 domain-containing protein, partial [Clostridia bacterium]